MIVSNMPKIPIEVAASQPPQSSVPQVEYHESHKLPLPEGWECRLDHRGRKYYVNHNARTTTWERPMPEKDFEGNLVVEEKPLPGGWEFRLDASGRKYYVDHNTRTTAWERPLSPDIETTKLPAGWEIRFGEGQRSTYFVDHNTMTTTWEDPRIHIYQLQPFTQFQRKIRYLHHKTVRQAKVPGTLVIRIRRSHVVEDSFALLIEQLETDLRKQPLVFFEGESSEADIREWFDLLFENLLDAKLGLFELDSANKVKIKIDATSANQLRYFKFVGLLHGLAIIHGILVDPKFVGIFYPMTVLRMDKTKGTDLIDSAVKDHLAQIKQTKLVSETNPYILDSRTGKRFSVDLKLEVGRYTFQNYSDKEELLEAFTAQRTGGAGRQLRAFMGGFWGLLDKKDTFLTYSQSELEKAIGGVSEIDLDLCSNSTEDGKQEPQEPDEHLGWFRKIVQSWSIERQRALLRYVTGLKRVPATDQFKVLKATDGHIRRLTVLGNKERVVPDNNADTPEHVLFIPAFKEYQAMEDELVSAIYSCDEWDETTLHSAIEGLSLNKGEDDGKST